ncbi:MAG: CoB--CoM heterodisulfide reductase iron-sulfur subunit B family protein [Bacillota bacterium]|nr:CoB--CoM heterodisulfide reductase iron-sulfur subunit B family protein [Bacillota bacterium]
MSRLRYAFYPGCTAHASARDYTRSTYATFRALGIELEEVPGWSCCGSTAVSNVDPLLGMALCARNLALAESTGLDLVVTCNACYANLAPTLEAYREERRVRDRLQRVLDAVDRHLEGEVEVRHGVHILTRDLGLDRVEEGVRRPLDGVKAVPYYGCLLSRPRNPYDDPENPTSLDELLATLGVEVLPFERKTKCCGGSFMNTKEEIALRLTFEILEEARERGAHLIVCACPLCQLNLDAYRAKLRARYGTYHDTPVLYFTQVVGLALGLDRRDLAIGQSFVPADRVLGLR